MGVAIVIILGLPALIEGLWFAYHAQKHSCFQIVYGPTACGSLLYVFSLLGIAFFLATLWLARLWKD